jgi:hypothetical protein
MAAHMGPARLRPVPAVAAACGGAAAWFTLGTLTVTEGGAGAARVGLLPPAWCFAGLVAAAIACAWAVRLTADRAKPLFFSAVLLLPWLPLPLPASALVWTGPVSGLVWVAIGSAMLGAGSISGGRWARTRAILADGRHAPWIAFACAAMMYGSAAMRLEPLLPGGDEPHYLVIAQSLWRDGDLKIENNHQRGDYLEYFGGSLRPDYLKRGQDGQIYSIHLPGVPVIIAPVLALGGYGLVKAFLALVSAAATAVAWRAAFLLTGSAAAAWFGWAAVAITAPFLLLSFTVYPDGPGAVVVLLAFAAAVSLHTRSNRRPWWWLAAGVLPAILPWFHPRFAVLAAALGLVLAGRALRETRLAASIVSFVAIPLVSAAAWFGYFRSIYGRFDPAAAYGHYTQMSAARIPVGLLGLLFDQQYGLLVYAPVFAVGIAGVVALARNQLRLAMEWLLVVVPYSIATGMYFMWWGGFSSPARFIGATLLVFSLPAAAAWAAASRPATRSLQCILLGVSVAIAVTLLVVEGGAFVFNVRDVLAPAMVWAGQVADLGRGGPSLFRLTPWAASAEAAVWVGALVAAWLGARAAAGDGRLQRGSAALAILGALGLAVSVSISSAWSMEGASGIAATTGQVRALRAAQSGLAAGGVTFEPFAVTSVGGSIARLRIGRDPAAVAPQGTWLWVPNLPAGRYRLWIDTAAGTPPFDVALVAGRSDGPLESWRFEGGAPGAASREFVLPVAVPSISVRGGEGERASVRGTWIQPVGRLDPTPLGRLHATSARRLGGVAVFAVSNVFLEPGGLWTAGGQSAEMVLLAEAGEDQAAFTMRAGPVATSVGIDTGMSAIETTLSPGEVRDLAIPVRRNEPTLVRIRTGQGFRPASIDPASKDVRLLGVRLEPR